MIEVIAILLIVFVVLLVMDVPIAVAIAVSAMLAMLLEGYDPNLMVASKLANGIDSFALLAIPFSFFRGSYGAGWHGGDDGFRFHFDEPFSGRFGICEYINLHALWVDLRIGRGCGYFIGGFMLPEMKNKGYNNEFSVRYDYSRHNRASIPPSTHDRLCGCVGNSFHRRHVYGGDSAGRIDWAATDGSLLYHCQANESKFWGKLVWARYGRPFRHAFLICCSW